MTFTIFSGRSQGFKAIRQLGPLAEILFTVEGGDLSDSDEPRYKWAAFESDEQFSIEQYFGIFSFDDDSVLLTCELLSVTVALYAFLGCIGKA